MNEKVQLNHPQGKTPIRMSKEKYDLLKPALLKCLRAIGEVTFSETLNAIKKELKAKGQTFQGSLPWHLEWVKLDLEARKLMRRVPNTSPQRYIIVP
jgi:hypothetical protein